MDVSVLIDYIIPMCHHSLDMIGVYLKYQFLCASRVYWVKLEQYNMSDLCCMIGQMLVCSKFCLQSILAKNMKFDYLDHTCVI